MHSVAANVMINALAFRVADLPFQAVDVRSGLDVAEAFGVVQFIAGPFEVASHIPLAGAGAATSVSIRKGRVPVPNDSGNAFLLASYSGFRGGDYLVCGPVTQ